MTVSCNVCSVVHHLVLPASLSSGLKGDFCPVHHVVCLINTNMVENYAHNWYRFACFQNHLECFVQSLRCDFQLHPKPISPHRLLTVLLLYDDALLAAVKSEQVSGESVLRGSPLTSAGLVLAPKKKEKKEKENYGRKRFTTRHLLHPIGRSLTSDTEFMSQ